MRHIWAEDAKGNEEGAHKKKVPVFGILERDGIVRVEVVKADSLNRNNNMFTLLVKNICNVVPNLL